MDTTPKIPTLSKEPVNPYGTPKEQAKKKFDFSKNAEDLKKDSGYDPLIGDKAKVKPAAKPDPKADEQEVKVIARVEALLKEDENRGWNDIAKIINEEFKTEYTWQALKGLTK